MVQCDQCQKVASERKAHGWYSLKTVLSMPTRAQLEEVDPVILKMTGLTVDDGQDVPTKVGGEFCSPSCLRDYVDSAAMLMELNEE